MPEINSLLIVSHVRHYRYNGILYAYAPYVREIDVWAEIFQDILIASPCCECEPEGDCAAFTQRTIRILPQKETGGETAGAKLLLIIALPKMIWQLCRAMRKADAIHVRCPGNLGLLGVIFAPFFSRYRIAKFAGQWGDYHGEARTVALQRRLLRSQWWGSPVTVYGDYPNQPAHVIPFFTSVLTKAQVQRARQSASRTREEKTLKILFVGRLAREKNVHILLDAIGQLCSQGIETQCAIVGDGIQRNALEHQAALLDIAGNVDFVGGVDFDRVLDFYEWADVLVLASETEGWPKAIAEAMAFGLLCIGSDRGLIPKMLGEGKGLIVPPGDVTALTAALAGVHQKADQNLLMRTRAAEWGQKYSLEGLRDALRELMQDHWKVQLVQSAPLSSEQKRVAE